MTADPNSGYQIAVTQDYPQGIQHTGVRIGGTGMLAPMIAAQMANAGYRLPTVRRMSFIERTVGRVVEVFHRGRSHEGGDIELF
jgi:hypothetical protein